MKNIFVTNITAGMSILGEDFAVKSLTTATMKDGRNYYNIELSDKTGNISGKIWPDAIAKSDITTEGQIVTIHAEVEKYRDNLQLRIISMVKTTNYNEADFMTTSNFDNKKMVAEFDNYLKKVKNPYLKKLLDSVFDEETRKIFFHSAAGITVHHDYVGGLLEHTLEILKMTDSLTESYPKLNQDLLISGAALHDIGKSFEYETGLTIRISTKGKLLGHIVMGVQEVANKAPKDMPTNLLDELLHIIISHHGELEFGSPVKPKTPEAIAIAMLDDASAKINAGYNTIHSLSDGALFTNYHRQLGTELYKSPYLDQLTNEDIPF